MSGLLSKIRDVTKPAQGALVLLAKTHATTPFQTFVKALISFTTRLTNNVSNLIAIGHIFGLLLEEQEDGPVTREIIEIHRMIVADVS